MPNKRVSFAQKHGTTNNNSGDDLFRKTDDQILSDNFLKEISNDPLFRRQTYYLDEDIIEAIREMSHQKRKEKSELVRELLRKSELKEYMKV